MKNNHRSVRTYNQLLSARTTFDEGGWNGDGTFDEEDLVAAFQIGHNQP